MPPNLPRPRLTQRGTSSPSNIRSEALQDFGRGVRQTGRDISRQTTQRLAERSDKRERARLKQEREQAQRQLETRRRIQEALLVDYDTDIAELLNRYPSSYHFRLHGDAFVDNVRRALGSQVSEGNIAITKEDAFDVEIDLQRKISGYVIQLQNRERNSRRSKADKERERVSTLARRDEITKHRRQSDMLFGIARSPRDLQTRLDNLGSARINAIRANIQATKLTGDDVDELEVRFRELNQQEERRSRTQARSTEKKNLTSDRSFSVKQRSDRAVRILEGYQTEEEVRSADDFNALAQPFIDALNTALDEQVAEGDPKFTEREARRIRQATENKATDIRNAFLKDRKSDVIEEEENIATRARENLIQSIRQTHIDKIKDLKNAGTGRTALTSEEYSVFGRDYLSRMGADIQKRVDESEIDLAAGEIQKIILDVENAFLGERRTINEAEVRASNQLQSGKRKTDIQREARVVSLSPMHHDELIDAAVHRIRVLYGGSPDIIRKDIEATIHQSDEQLLPTILKRLGNGQPPTPEDDSRLAYLSAEQYSAVAKLTQAMEEGDVLSFNQGVDELKNFVPPELRDDVEAFGSEAVEKLNKNRLFFIAQNQYGLTATRWSPEVNQEEFVSQRLALLEKIGLEYPKLRQSPIQDDEYAEMEKYVEQNPENWRAITGLLNALHEPKVRYDGQLGAVARLARVSPAGFETFQREVINLKGSLSSFGADQLNVDKVSENRADEANKALEMISGLPNGRAALDVALFVSQFGNRSTADVLGSMYNRKIAVVKRNGAYVFVPRNESPRFIDQIFRTNPGRQEVDGVLSWTFQTPAGEPFNMPVAYTDEELRSSEIENREPDFVRWRTGLLFSRPIGGMSESGWFKIDEERDIYELVDDNGQALYWRDESGDDLRLVPYRVRVSGGRIFIFDESLER